MMRVDSLKVEQGKLTAGQEPHWLPALHASRKDQIKGKDIPRKPHLKNEPIADNTKAVLGGFRGKGLDEQGYQPGQSRSREQHKPINSIQPEHSAFAHHSRHHDKILNDNDFKEPILGSRLPQALTGPDNRSVKKDASKRIICWLLRAGHSCHQSSVKELLTNPAGALARSAPT
jgi:hypothetical protein